MIQLLKVDTTQFAKMMSSLVTNVEKSVRFVMANCCDCGDDYELHSLDDDLRCDDCSDEWKAQNNDNRLCEICNKKPPRTPESKYCQKCRDWFKRS